MWRRLVYWQGAFGYPRLLISNYAAQPSTLPGHLDTYLESVSNARIVQVSEGLVTPLTPAPALTGAYPSVVQLAVCTYLDSGSSQGTIRVPAPLRSIFLADGITVDPTNADVVALGAQIMTPTYPIPTNGAAVSTRDGLLYSNLIGGVFIGRKISRKMNKFVYNPELTVRGI